MRSRSNRTRSPTNARWPRSISTWSGWNARSPAAHRERVAATEERDRVQDELAHYRRLKPVQTDSSTRQEQLRTRLLPAIHDQLDRLRANLTIVRAKLDNLIVRAPAAGRITAIDLKVGENRAPGQRLAEITPDTGVCASSKHLGQIGA